MTTAQTTLYVGLTLFAAVSTARADWPCPCALALPGFQALIEPNHVLGLCTHDAPGFLGGLFVRIVDFDRHLAAAYTLSGQTYCAWQGPDPSGFAIALPVTRQEFQSCQHLLLHAATRQGLPCRQERF